MVRRTLPIALIALSGAALAVWLPDLMRPGQGGGGPEQGEVAAALGRGGLAAYALVFVGGFLTSLTPCVYPLIPITVSIFGATSAKSRLAGAGLSAAYVGGMVVMYAAVGVAAALTGQAFGALLGNPWIVGGIALLLVLLAASMFGLYELRLPSSVLTRASQVRGVGPLAAFAMGLVAGVIAAPCTGPVLSGVLALVASTRDVVTGFGLLATYALGIGVLFMAIGTFSISLPKSGAWMETVKTVFGIALVGAALWFVAPLLPDAHVKVPALAAAALVGVGLLLALRTRRVLKGAGVALALTGFVLRFAAAPPDFPWVLDHGQAVTLARSNGMPMMIDFFADWCVACKELDKFTYVDKSVRSEAQRFVSLKLDLTDPSDELEELQERYGVQALPTVVFVDSLGKVLSEPRVTGFIAAGEMLELMRKVQ